MSQHKIRVISYLLVLVLCATLMSGCIHPEEGDFPTTPSNTESTPIGTPEVTTPHVSAPEETTPTVTVPTVTTEVTTPDVTTPSITTPTVTTPDVTTPDVTTSDVTTPDETTAEVTTPPEETTLPEETTPPETTTEGTEVPPTPDNGKIKIYIDQGHNPFLPKQDPLDPTEELKGWNTGASNVELGLYEQDLTYEIGMMLFELLSQDDRFEVRVSRPTADTILGTDNNSALDFRVNDAAEWGADYFISLHINSFTNDTVTGLEVYTANGDEIGYALGEDILNSLVDATELRRRGMKDGSNLRVLKNATMPAVLVEMGFISNPNDAKLLDESPELFAQAVYDGIINYFASVESGTQELCFCMTCCKKVALKFVSGVLPQILSGVNTTDLLQEQTVPLSITTSMIPQGGELILSSVCTAMLPQAMAFPFLRLIPQIGIWLLMYLVQTL